MSHQAADNRDPPRFLRNGFGSFAIAFYEPWALDQVARRIAAHRQLGEKDEVDAAAPGAPRIFDYFCGIARKIPDDGIDLTQCDPHVTSVKAHPCARQINATGLCLWPGCERTPATDSG